jgi:NADH-quinone oxidoreductase subunit J
VETIISPVILYIALALGAIGVGLALPRKGVSPQVLGGLIAGAAGGLAILGLSLKAFSEHLPNVYFYVFAVVALGSALRVITHPRPVYAALYFILTIIATAGLFLILSAEFMAFALIIVYAGAILITYLFVIMLATQASAEDEESTLIDYDTVSREPVAATVVGFLLLGVLTTMLFRGLPGLPTPKDASVAGREALSNMPSRLEAAYREKGLIAKDESIVGVIYGTPAINFEAGTATIQKAGGAETRELAWPEGVTPSNAEGLGFNLLRDHPGTIEIAGVILLMAMLGAVVLSRKQVEMDEDEKRRQAHLLASRASSGAGGSV